MWHLFGPDGALSVDGPKERAQSLCAFHTHHAVQLSFGLEGPLQVALAGRAQTSMFACLIAPDVAHAIRGRAVHFMCEPETATGRRLLGLLSGACVTPVAPYTASDLLSLIKDADNLPTGTALEASLSQLLSDLLRHGQETPPLEERIAHVVTQLSQSSHHVPTLEELSQSVYLSPSRLRHLFVEEVGIPIRQYVLWRRSIAAMEHIIHGSALGGAAYATGFPDQAALSRTHRRLFGRTPSEFARDSFLGYDFAPSVRL